MASNKLLCPSMMCADFGGLQSEMRALEAAGCDIFHLDVMDGHFVPNHGMGIQDIEYIAANARIPCDVHLMVCNPDDFIGRYAGMGIQYIYVHPEAGPHIPRTLQSILDAGATPGIAINPGTAYETIQPLLHLAGCVCVMTVNPGFAGQKYLDWVDEKIERLASVKQQHGFTLTVDGACSPEVIKHLSQKGADGFVLGTSALFGKGRPYAELISELRAL